jgi:hypothetical protein
MNNRNSNPFSSFVRKPSSSADVEKGAMNPDRIMVTAKRIRIFLLMTPPHVQIPNK